MLWRLHGCGLPEMCIRDRLYSLPSRDIIADSVEYMVNAHKADAMVCISNCDKITPGMLMAAMSCLLYTSGTDAWNANEAEQVFQHFRFVLGDVFLYFHG